MSYCVVLCRTVSYRVVLCRTVSYCVVLCRTVSYCVVLCRTVSYCVVRCRCCTTPCTTLYDASYIPDASGPDALYDTVRRVVRSRRVGPRHLVRRPDASYSAFLTALTPSPPLCNRPQLPPPPPPARETVTWPKKQRKYQAPKKYFFRSEFGGVIRGGSRHLVPPPPPRPSCAKRGDCKRGGFQLLGAADTQTAHPATSSTAPTRQLLGSANAETTPAGAPAAAADRTQRPDATCEGKNG